jgi:hypothetical protein
MRNLVAFPILILAVVLQSAIVSRISLLAGFGDLVLVMLVAWALQEGVVTGWHWAGLAALLMAFVSGLPWFVTLISYVASIFMAQLLQRRIWQAPMLAMFLVTFLGTLFYHLLSFAVLRISGLPLPFGDAMGLVALPSLLLNLLLALPLYWLMRDLARWVYPVEDTE